MPAASKPSAPVVKLKPRSHARSQDNCQGRRAAEWGGDQPHPALFRVTDNERFARACLRQQIVDLNPDWDAGKESPVRSRGLSHTLGRRYEEEGARPQSA